MFKDGFRLAVRMTAATAAALTMSAAAAGATQASDYISEQAQFLAAHQLSDGAILGPGDEINPYFANVAAIGLARANTSAGNAVVYKWMQWYLRHLNTKDSRGFTDTVYDYNYNPSTGAETSAGRSSQSTYYQDWANTSVQAMTKTSANGGLWDTANNNWDWALGSASHPASAFYPDATAQLWPTLFGVVAPGSPQATAAWKAFTGAYLSWDTDNIPDSYPWTSMARAAQLMGDSGGANTLLATLENKYAPAGVATGTTTRRAGSSWPRRAPARDTRHQAFSAVAAEKAWARAWRAWMWTRWRR
jgi:hypothetical protein